jgi:glyoxylase-like metal-dependent hydrolase (beta-lactamase superfamily II)
MNELKLGDVTVTRIEEMHGPILPPDQFFPEMPEEAWREHREMLVPDHLNADGGMVRGAFQTWLLRSSGRTVLIDTGIGIGNDKTRPGIALWDHLQLDYLGNLARAGVRPEDVDLVVNTHLHPDHIGWNTRLVDGTWVPTFPNATHLMTKADFVFWDPANNPDITGGVNENAFDDSVAPVHAAGQVQLWEGTHTIDANLRLEAAPGHTPGSSVVKLASGGDQAERHSTRGDTASGYRGKPEPDDINNPRTGWVQLGKNRFVTRSTRAWPRNGRVCGHAPIPRSSKARPSSVIDAGSSWPAWWCGPGAGGAGTAPGI